ncbi:hypothetical protein JW992_14595 [candidate division KSB1 bacterium]|nr:hypothetical protein [candidate division KSB1 bacterium]
MKRCQNCVLPETFPGIHFDEKGVCNYCRAFNNNGKQKMQSNKERYRMHFDELCAKLIPAHNYDCIAAYSGGKDSTFTLKILVEQYKLRLLAVTVDNGFLSPHALKNIDLVSEALNIDRITVKPQFDLLREIFVAGSKNDLFPPKTLERASTICTSCMGIVKAIVLKTALKLRIPFIAYGWSPGQAPLSASIFHNNPSMIQQMQKAIQTPVRSLIGPQLDHVFLGEKDFAADYLWPYNIHPLAFLDYDEEKIVRIISEMGWNPPSDTDANSTNCLLNSYANVVHKKRHHFNPYAFEMANLVRQSYCTRAEALEKLERPESPVVIQAVKNKLYNNRDKDLPAEEE